MKSLIGHLRRPDIIFRSNGMFDLSARVVRELGILHGDVVDVMEERGEYFLYVAHPASSQYGRFGARCVPSKGTGRHFRGYSVRLCKSILRACGESQRVALPCGKYITAPDGRKMLPVIIRLNLNK